VAWINKKIPFRVSKQVASDTLYILAVESALADANFVPVELKAISKT
jgi:hypothetical protein